MYYYSFLKVDKTPFVDAETSLGVERLSKPLMTAVPIIHRSLVLQSCPSKPEGLFLTADWVWVLFTQNARMCESDLFIFQIFILLLYYHIAIFLQQQQWLMSSLSASLSAKQEANYKSNHLKGNMWYSVNDQQGWLGLAAAPSSQLASVKVPETVPPTS